MNQPLKIIVKFHDKKITTKLERSDIPIDELHDLWLGILQGMGYSNKTIKKFYEHIEEK